MDITEDTYILGVWYFEHKNIGNLMITVSKNGKGKWCAEIRVRSYVDDKVFGSDDRKMWYKREWGAGTSKEDVLKSVETLLDLYEKVHKPEIRDFALVEGDAERMAEVLATKEWASMKKVDLNNPEDVKWCEENGIDIETLKDKEEVGD